MPSESQGHMLEIPDPTQLEYASTVWDPSTESNISKVGAIQRRAADFVTGDYRLMSNLSIMLQHLGWVKLQTRIQHTKATIMHCILLELVEILTAPYFHHTSTQRRGYDIRILQPFTTVNSFPDSFPSSIRLCNSLPTSLIDTPFLEVFQTRI